MTDTIHKLHGNSNAAKALKRAEQAAVQEEVRAHSISWPPGWAWETSLTRITRIDNTRVTLQLSGWVAPETEEDIRRRTRVHERRMAGGE